MAAKFDQDSCSGCGVCAEACPVTAITVDDVAKVNAELCTDCGTCVDECPVGAITKAD